MAAPWRRRGSPISAPQSARSSRLTAHHPSADPTDGPGAVRWLGGLRFSGWVSADQDPAAMNVLVDGILIDRLRISRWSHVGSWRGRQGRSELRCFSAAAVRRWRRSPVRYRHGERRKSYRQSAHVPRPLPTGSAISLPRMTVSARKACGPNCSTNWCRRRCRSPVITSGWQRFPVAGAPAATELCGVVMVGPGEIDDTLASLEKQSGADWIAAAITAEKTPTGFQPDLVQGFLEGEGADCGYLLFGLAGTVLAPNALQRIGYAFSAFEDAQAVYGDVDVRGDEGSAWPLALSAFDYERMLEQGYCAHLFALRSSRLRDVWRQGRPTFIACLIPFSTTRTASSDDIIHLPGSLGMLPVFDRAEASTTLADASLAHLQERGIEAEAMDDGRGCCFPPRTWSARSSRKA